MIVSRVRIIQKWEKPLVMVKVEKVMPHGGIEVSMDLVDFVKSVKSELEFKGSGWLQKLTKEDLETKIDKAVEKVLEEMRG